MVRLAILSSLIFIACAQRPAARIEFNLSRPVVACSYVSQEEVGQLPLEVPLGDQVVRITEWTIADEAHPNPVGFAARIPPGVTFTVVSGAQVFQSNEERWLHPQGLSGPAKHGIDGLTFCTTVAPTPVLAAVR